MIDFLSLDIEGAEYIALKLFPFDEYIFRCMVIERPNRQLNLLLHRHNYRQVAHLNYDVVYMHADFLNELNLDPKIRFMFTPRKGW